MNTLEVQIWLKRKGISQAEIARKIKITPALVTMVLKNKRPGSPGEKEVIRRLKRLGCPGEFLAADGRRETPMDADQGQKTAVGG